MNLSKSDEKTESGDTGLTVIAVPPEMAPSVLDFIVGLNTQDDEVAGHMIGGMGSISNRPLAANQKHATGTGCLSSPTGWKCSDIDRTPGDE